jgi:hypothetical protein
LGTPGNDLTAFMPDPAHPYYVFFSRALGKFAFVFGRILTNDQYEMARTVYMQWLRKANKIVQLPTCESLPHKK